MWSDKDELQIQSLRMSFGSLDQLERTAMRGRVIEDILLLRFYFLPTVVIPDPFGVSSRIPQMLNLILIGGPIKLGG